MSDGSISRGRLPTIVSYGLDSVGIISNDLADASAIWPTANLAIFVPFRIAEPRIAVQLFAKNGATVSGNIDIGIYDRTGVRLVSAGSTVQSGVNDSQEFNITDTLLGAGVFLLAVALDNITGTTFRIAPANAGVLKQFGCAQQATAFALPATATLATITSAYLPYMGIQFRTLL